MRDKTAEEANGYGAQPPPPCNTTIVSSSQFLTVCVLLTAAITVLHITHQPLGTAL